MVRLLVLYGQPEDPAAFDRYYHEIHVPLAKRMQGLRKWTIGKVLGKDVKHMQVGEADFRGAMSQFGVSDSAADCFLEMYDGFAKGRIVHESTPRPTATTWTFPNPDFRYSPGYERHAKEDARGPGTSLVR